jgi:hypothetical protein
MISGEGLFTAGTNTGDTAVVDMIKVTDDNYGFSATARVMINSLPIPPAPEVFEISITPRDRIVASKGGLSFGAVTTAPVSSFGSPQLIPPDYEWSVISGISSVIDPLTGAYTAGNNEIGHQVTDMITVIDHANNDAATSVEVVVTYGEITSIFPSKIFASRWIPLPHTFMILGKNLNIDRFYTLPRFEPNDDIKLVSKFGFGNFMLLTIMVKSQPVTGKVDIILDTIGEFAVANDKHLTINMFPWKLDEENRVRAQMTNAAPEGEIVIRPESSEVISQGSLQFYAATIYDDKVVKGSYKWEIDPASDTGSTISGEGLFTAGTNTGDAAVVDMVKVTDVNYGFSATAKVMINPLPIPPTPEVFEVSITPGNRIVASKGDLSFSAVTKTRNTSYGSPQLIPPDYEWSVISEIGSVIDSLTGAYTAGNNEIGHQVTDMITVIDHANNDAATSVEVVVTCGEITSIFPSKVFASRWIPLPYLLILMGENLNIDRLYTLPRFEPNDDIKLVSKFWFGNFMLLTIMVKPKPVTGEVNIFLDTHGEFAVANDKHLTINMLPWKLDEENRVKAQRE